jgi:hypothetical protein
VLVRVRPATSSKDVNDIKIIELYVPYCLMTFGLLLLDYDDGQTKVLALLKTGGKRAFWQM